jgi:hypothetical protein
MTILSEAWGQITGDGLNRLEVRAGVELGDLGAESASHPRASREHGVNRVHGFSTPQRAEFCFCMPFRAGGNKPGLE